ncbi:MAG: peptidylprolyl isomerase [Elusimicrobia bacterium]|nr:peptidylprolyl isomerase [Elusimicrobiota bacterium]
MNSSGRILLSAVIVGSLAQAAGAKLMEDAVATVNGQPVLLSEYQKELKNTLEMWERNQPGAVVQPERLKELREKILEQLIDHEVMFQEGGKLKLKVRERDIEQGIEEVKTRFTRDEAGKTVPEAEADENFKKQLKAEGVSFTQFRERISRQVMIRKVIESEVRQKVTPPDEKEIKEYFEKAKAYIVSGSSLPPKGMEEEAGLIFMEVARDIRLMSSERVRVSRILVRFSPGASPGEKKRARQAAMDLKKRLDEGKIGFAELAKAESEDPESAARGGDIGFIFKGLVPPEIEKVAFSLDVGVVSQPVETDTGFHIIRIVEKRAAETPEFASFREQLGQFLMNVHFGDELNKYVKGIKAKAIIERKLPN